MRKQMRIATEKAGLPRIRVHDLRHSHVSLLIDLGFPAPAIAEKIGHSSISVTYTYAHLFPVRQHDMLYALEAEEACDELSEGGAEKIPDDIVLGNARAG